MFSRQQRSGDDRGPVSGTGKAALAAACIAALVCEYFLLSYRHSASRARSGELLSGTYSGMPVTADDSLLGYAFSYFGTVTYFFPWLIVYFTWFLIVRPPVLRQIDLFRVGLRILGFNVLVIGLCSLFSALFAAGHTGAGGVLGDFLNIYLFSRLPHAAAPLIPVLLTLAGALLFSTKSPLWLCERIGSFFSGLLGLDKLKRRLERGKTAAAAAAPVSAGSPAGESSAEGKAAGSKSKKESGPRRQRRQVEPSFGPAGLAGLAAAGTAAAAAAPAGLRTAAVPGSAPAGSQAAAGALRPAAGASRSGAAAWPESYGSSAAAPRQAAARPAYRDSGSSGSGGGTLQAAAAAMQQTLNARGSRELRRTGTTFVREPGRSVNAGQGAGRQGRAAAALQGRPGSAFQGSSSFQGAAPGSVEERVQQASARVATAEALRSLKRGMQQGPETVTVPDTELASAAVADASGDSSRPSTIIRDSRRPSGRDTEAADAEAQGQSTIITKSALPPSEGPRDVDPYYLYNKYKNSPDRSAVTSGSGAAVAEAEEPAPEESDEGGSSTIIIKNDSPVASGPRYVAGAPGAQTDTVGNPWRRSLVSTVITRGSTVTQMQFGEQISVDDGSTAAAVTAEAVPEDSTPAAAAGGAEEDARALQDGLDQHEAAGSDPEGGSMHAARSGVDAALASGSAAAPEGADSAAAAAEASAEVSPEENIISFSDYPQQQDKPIEVGSLPSAFVPSYGEEQEDDGPAPLRRGQEHLSEKDSSFGPYNHALRGISAAAATVAAAVTGNSENSGGTAGSAVPAAGRPEPEPAAAVPAAAAAAPAAEASAGADEAAGDAAERVPGRPAAPLDKIPLRPYLSSVLTVPQHHYDDWRPSLELMARSNQSMEVDEEYIRSMTARIDGFMRDYHIAARVADYQPGPVITRYDLHLEPGTRSVAIRQKQVDLCRLLMVGKVRIIDVIPGTPYVGLEVPNARRQLITLRDVAERPEFAGTRAALPLCLGVNTIGTAVIADLAKAPHLLIAGTTGSGKSAGINSMLLSLILKLSPAQLRLILIDPKQVEFGNYNDLPHLITPVISEMEQAAAALGWCIGEMERRYTLIKNMRVHNLAEYNRVLEDAAAAGRELYDPLWSEDMGGSPEVLRPLPFVVVVVDEFADLMAMSASHGKKSDGKSPDSMIARLTAKARAAGIHLILATQTPRSDVVTGMIKANMPSKIAYTVQSGIDSKIILDEWGAENLLGNGDMLVKYMHLENYAIFRAHGPYASNDDVRNVVGAWIDHSGTPEYLDGVSDSPDEESEGGGAVQEDAGSSHDRLFDEVAAYARDYYASNNKIPSITNIQITFGIGYTRAKRLMMQLQREHAIDG